MASRLLVDDAPMLRPAVCTCDECPLGRRGGCRFRPRAVESGAGLWGQGERLTELVFIKSGVLGVSASDADGRELVGGVRGPQSLLGFEGLRAEPARTSVVALTDAVVCSAPVAATPPSASELEALFQLALDELAQSARDLELRAGPALGRVARFLSRHAALLAPYHRDAFSKRHVATLLDMRPETLSRCLRRLSRMRLIAQRPTLRVLDPEGLAALAEGEALEVRGDAHVRRGR